VDNVNRQQKPKKWKERKKIKQLKTSFTKSGKQRKKKKREHMDAYRFTHVKSSNDPIHDTGTKASTLKGKNLFSEGRRSQTVTRRSLVCFRTNR